MEDASTKKKLFDVHAGVICDEYVGGNQRNTRKVRAVGKQRSKGVVKRRHEVGDTRVVNIIGIISIDSDRFSIGDCHHRA
jgi:hypothetical protein